MEISRALPEQYAAIVQLVNESYRGDVSRLGWTTEADLFSGHRIDLASLQQMIEAPGARLFVYALEGECQGCVYLRNDDRGLYLGMLTVHPRRQSDGIGGRLLRFAEEYAKSGGSKLIYMRVIDSRTELLEWYHRKGYIDSGERVPFIASGADAPLRPIRFAILVKQITSNEVFERNITV